MNNILGQILWTQNFLGNQGYKVVPSNINQDNKGAMLLKINGILSSSKQTKHINVRYYFIKDKIERNKVNVIYCPTNKMIGNFFTKPLQGSRFIKFRDAILRLSHFDSTVKERVNGTAAHQLN